MAETLYIRLGSQAQDKIHWLIYSKIDQEIIASGELANAKALAELSEKSNQRNVTVFVPSCDVALKSLYVPSKSSRAMKLAAPYMLEDELAQDVEQLFFAYGNPKIAAQDKPADEKQDKSNNANNCFVAVVDRNLMQLWLSWLNDAEILCKTMLPDVLAMPIFEHEYSAVILGQQLILRQNAWQGFTLDLSAWSMISAAWSKDDTAIIINTFSTLACDDIITVKPQPEELPLALLAQHSQQQSFNLLQGEFVVKEKRSPVLTHWLWVAGLAAFALVFNLGVKGVQLIQVNNAQAVVEQQIIKTYKDAFPNSKRVRINTIKSQLKRKLAQVGGLENQAGFLAMLSKVRPAFAEVPQLKPESLKFDGKRQEIRINAVASDYQFFEKFKTEIEKTQLTVNQGAQNNQGDQVSGSFSISTTNKRRTSKGGKS